tara:strand:- start:3135 stop:3557 length:423 start_codon:yes stop_codon:yes gene_type:complete
MSIKPTVTIRFPAPLPAEVPCPICLDEETNKSTGCLVCDRTGKVNITVDAKVPIQRALIIKYVAENLRDVASALSEKWGLIPEVETEEVADINNKQYEIVRISSVGGVVWVVNRLDELENPRYFKTYKELAQFRSGWIEE